MVKIDLTEDDLVNIGKWITATSMVIQANLRTPLSPSENETWVKIERARRLLRVQQR